MADISMDLYLAYEDGYKKGKAETEAYLLHCGDETPITNADLIRKMTDEELAEFIEPIADCKNCNIQTNSCFVCSETCRRRWLEWLRSEADEHTD